MRPGNIAVFADQLYTVVGYVNATWKLRNENNLVIVSAYDKDVRPFFLQIGDKFILTFWNAGKGQMVKRPYTIMSIKSHRETNLPEIRCRCLYDDSFCNLSIYEIENLTLLDR